MNKNKLKIPFLVIALLAGAGIGIAGMAGAQSAVVATSATTTAAVNGQTIPKGMAHRHAPLGGDGVVTAINGSTITMTEESDEGGAVYTVDASKALVSQNGATSILASVKVGDKIFVTGPTAGTNVSATEIRTGISGRHSNIDKPDYPGDPVDQTDQVQTQ